MKSIPAEIQPLVDRLMKLRASGRVQVAMLYGSFALGSQHSRSDIDVALAITAEDYETESAVIDDLLMSVDRDVSILRLNDPDESPLVVQAALRGVHLVDPDWPTYYEIADRALHESESIRFRREMKNA